jgi:hypothetical protein
MVYTYKIRDAKNGRLLMCSRHFDKTSVLEAIADCQETIASCRRRFGVEFFGEIWEVTPAQVRMFGHLYDVTPGTTRIVIERVESRSADS